MKKLSQMVSQAPERPPLNMVFGNAKGLHGDYNSARDLHESLGNRDRVAYLKKKILKEQGGSFSGKGFGPVAVWLDIQSLHGSVIKSACLDSDNMHITVQSESMLQSLQSTSQDEGRVQAGVITDVTHSFFKAGFLLSSSVYCNLLHRWVPVLYTWMYGQTAAHHVQHFVVLIDGILELDVSYDEQNRLMAQVVDFSNAQKNAFIQAYQICRTKNNIERNWTPSSVEKLELEVHQLIRGIAY